MHIVEFQWDSLNTFWLDSIKLSDEFSVHINLVALNSSEKCYWDSFSQNNINLFVLILLSIMFHAPMGRFQLELFIFIIYFTTVVPFISCFLSCKPFVVNATVSIGFLGFWSFFCLLALVVDSWRKENTTIEWDDGGKIDNNNEFFVLFRIKLSIDSLSIWNGSTSIGPT